MKFLKHNSHTKGISLLQFYGFLDYICLKNYNTAKEIGVSLFLFLDLRGGVEFPTGGESPRMSESSLIR